MSRSLALLTLFLSASLHCSIEHPSYAQTYKQLPPDGITIDDSSCRDLTQRTKDLSVRCDLLGKNVAKAERWLPEVQSLIRAVNLALDLNGFYREREINDANKLLDEAERRLVAVAKGTHGLELLGFDPAETDTPQTLVGGFRSRIDDSIQPYGIVLPKNFQQNSQHPYRLDVWLHGRGDTKTEVAFLTERRARTGQYAPENTIVLHPFGRHCNAFKFAGEIDVFEAIERIKQIANIDASKVAIRGFSMGGAGCWHLAVHRPTDWFAANPGAGFVDTLVYQGWTNETPYPLTPSRKKLLNWYDVLPWVGNLRNVSTTAYSGEVDKQRLAADRVVENAAALNIDIEYVIGNGMGHKIDDASAQKIDSLLAKQAAEQTGLAKPSIDFTTYTLRYAKADWVEVTGLEEHWTAGRIQAAAAPNQTLNITTSGITRFKIDFAKAGWTTPVKNIAVNIDGQSVSISTQKQLENKQIEFKKSIQWTSVDLVDNELRKRPGLQGPIDDAFCDRFLFVAPSKDAVNSATQQWITREFEYAKHRWRKLMRGEVRVVRDSELTPQMIQNNHLVCFGDFSSNQYLKEVQSELPIVWSSDSLTVSSEDFDASNHAVVMCYPNPKNQNKYLVINSGMTYREFSNVSNSRQIAMLPDWAIIRTDSPNDDIFPGEVVADGFFDESWQLAP